MKLSLNGDTIAEWAPTFETVSIVGSGTFWQWTLFLVNWLVKYLSFYTGIWENEVNYLLCIQMLEVGKPSLLDKFVGMLDE